IQLSYGVNGAAKVRIYSDFWRIYILKLDKNFHTYIHGNREMIEKGTDPDGRKFYKIYFENEE
ncbi:MAG: hypothetical protein ACKO6I_01410, partial [Sphingomonadales bacterium]